MKKAVSNNILKAMTGVMLFAVPMFVACEKENTASTNDDGTGGNTQQKHNVELVYGDKPSTNWQNISFDTLYKYNTDPMVDSIFMVLEKHNQFSALSTNSLKQCVARLRDRHNVNNNKIFGKGNIELNAESVQNNQEIVRFFADTLKYNVISR